MKNGDFLNTGQSIETEYIVEDLLMKNRMAMVASVPGQGKSLFSVALLYHIAYAAPFLGKQVCLGNVMLIDSENRRDVLVTRIKKIRKGLESDGYKKQAEVDIQHYCGLLLDDKNTWTPIVNELRSLQPSLIVFDHLLCFHNQDEDRARPMERVAEAIEEMMTICGSSVVILHHFNKNRGSFFQRLRGSSAIHAKTDTSYEVRSLLHREGKLEKIGIIPQPRKEKILPPFRVRIEEGDDWLKLIWDGTFEPVEDPRMDTLCHQIYHIFIQDKDSKTVYAVKEILAGLASDSEIRDCLRTLYEKELVTVGRVGKGHKYLYRLKRRERCPWCGIKI